MGAVYKARQPGLNRTVALKLLPPQSEPDFAERFTREAQALAQLNHPNIVAVYDFGQVTSGLHFLIMEYVDGLNLRQIERAERLSPRDALRIIPEICAALQFAHDEGIVHRDIKPENVLIDKRGRVKIADFGLAKMLGHETGNAPLTGVGQVMGTPHYMAPEQIEHPAEVDHRADIYSLGVVFYEMLTGELPLGRFAPPSRKVQIDVRLDEVVLRALEKEPEQRYDHVSEMKTQVETIAQSPSKPEPSPSLGIPPILSAQPLKSSAQGSILGVFIWQGALLALFTGLFGHFFPVAINQLKDLSVPMPPVTMASFRFASAVQHYWFVLIPMLIGINCLVLLGIQKLLGTRAFRWWSAALICALFATAATSAIAIYLPYSATISHLAPQPKNDGPTVDSNPPVVVETYPISGSDSVAPGVTEIWVRFSKDMADGSWSWSSAWQDSEPDSVESPKYLDDHRTCISKVSLKPGTTYGFWLNSEKYHNFKDTTGKAAVPYLFTFRTRQE